MATGHNQGAIGGLIVDPEVDRFCLEGAWPRCSRCLLGALREERDRKNKKNQGVAEHFKPSVLDELGTRESNLNRICEVLKLENLPFTGGRKPP